MHPNKRIIQWVPPVVPEQPNIAACFLIGLDAMHKLWYGLWQQLFIGMAHASIMRSLSRGLSEARLFRPAACLRLYSCHIQKLFRPPA